MEKSSRSWPSFCCFLSTFTMGMNSGGIVFGHDGVLGAVGGLGAGDRVWKGGSYSVLNGREFAFSLISERFRRLLAQSVGGLGGVAAVATRCAKDAPSSAHELSLGLKESVKPEGFGELDRL